MKAVHQTLLFAGLLVFRILNALSIKTFFQPDEYFQSLEPAWQLAFGPTSGAWITWEWTQGLRSSIHPYLFALVYRFSTGIRELVQLTPYQHAEVLIFLPKVTQAIFAAVLDLFTWRLAGYVYRDEQQISITALILTVASPWQWFCSTRTFSNCIETTLTAVALDLTFRSWKTASGRMGSLQQHVSLVIAAIACILRPTNGIIWSTILGLLVFDDCSIRKFGSFVVTATTCGIAVLALSLGIDASYYGKAIFPPLQFLYFNLAQSLAIFYGSNRRDYYFTEGLPLLLTTALPFGLIGLWQSLRSAARQFGLRPRFILTMAVLTSVLALSCISHKEVRFIYPLLPILHVLAAKPFAHFFTPPRPTTIFKTILLLLLLGVNIFIAAYTTQVHQRGVVDVVHFLRHEQESHLTASPPTNITAAFLMPCHSTPWRSHLVYPEISAWALTCEPPINQTPAQRAAYLDEADVFYADPRAWIDANMESRASIVTTTMGDGAAAEGVQAGRRSWPMYLMFFEQLRPVMEEVLGGTVYAPCKSFFNTHWHDDGRRQGKVEVWCKQSPKAASGR